jgi:hypothetical protein
MWLWHYDSIWDVKNGGGDFSHDIQAQGWESEPAISPYKAGLPTTELRCPAEIITTEHSVPYTALL